MYPRLFSRVRPSGKMSATAKLVVGPKAPVIDCRVVDYSPGGACLEIWGETKLPDRFEMVYGGTRKRCRVVWKPAGGLAFRFNASCSQRKNPAICGGVQSGGVSLTGSR